MNGAMIGAMNSANFFLLCRWRRRYFQNMSFDLYRRYAHILCIVLGLAGMVLNERPGLIAEPLLSFFHSPTQWRSSLSSVLIWAMIVTVWAKVHRKFVVGGDLSGYTHSFPVTKFELYQVDMVLLLSSLAVFAIPFLIAAYIVLRSAQPLGTDNQFWFYYASLLVMTVTISKSVTFGATVKAKLGALFAAIVLVVFPALGKPWLGPATLATVLSLLYGTLSPRNHEQKVRQSAAGNRQATRSPPFRVNRFLSFLLFQLRMLFVSHLHAFFPRIALVVMYQSAVCWLIYYAENTRNALLFLQFSTALAACTLSGIYQIFFSARCHVDRYATTTAYGNLILVLVDHILAVAIAIIAFTPFFLFHGIVGEIAAPSYLLATAAIHLCLLLILGMHWIRRNRNGVVIKFAFTIAWIIIAQGLL